MSFASLEFSIRPFRGRGIHIKGSDVSLFDMVNGKCIEQTAFDAAPDSWQDFVVTHRAAPPQGAEWSTSSSLRVGAQQRGFGRLFGGFWLVLVVF